MDDSPYYGEAPCARLRCGMGAKFRVGEGLFCTQHANKTPGAKTELPRRSAAEQEEARRQADSRRAAAATTAGPLDVYVSGCNIYDIAPHLGDCVTVFVTGRRHAATLSGQLTPSLLPYAGSICMQQWAAAVPAIANSWRDALTILAEYGPVEGYLALQGGGREVPPAPPKPRAPKTADTRKPVEGAFLIPGPDGKTRAFNVLEGRYLRSALVARRVLADPQFAALRAFRAEGKRLNIVGTKAAQIPVTPDILLEVFCYRGYPWTAAHIIASLLVCRTPEERPWARFRAGLPVDVFAARG